ncbi:MAG TPA: LPS assembly protein LptD [Arenimonas sp.]|uniref:LPS assembly protein LptD n=1 Tax=Arenimonas sp. TaxID=1872635 RepID=UPI002C4ECB97|nr:LPS assembly protein LptD [Arenimonas sp.]HMB56145.1 LPS assembly protein LptD [Arenimonas sp.]
MRRSPLRLLPLCLAISGAVHAQATVDKADKPQWQLCANPGTLPWFVERQPAAGDRIGTPSDIVGDALDLKKDDVTVFSGNVVLTHADQWLHTDKITYTHPTEQFVSDGPVQYQDYSVRLTADKASGDQKADTITLDQVTYQFNQQLGNGTSKRAVMKGEIGELSSATYSTCPPTQQQWQFRASKIRVNNETATGVATNVSLRLGRIPVLWLPVISFPTDNRRRTGVLSPTVGRDDHNGLDIKLPVYLNLAPNYDATLTPRWLSKRGLMLEGEFRYLTENSRGTFEGTFLPDDKLTGHDRGYVSIDHTTTLNRHWYLSANLKNVSDVDYFSDFGDSIANTSISLVDSQLGLFGRGKYWSASLSAEEWQITNPLIAPGNEPYRRLPRLQASAFRPLTHWLEAGVSAEAVRFSHENRPDAGTRVDLQPYIRMPFSGSAWFITPQLSWRYTAYSLNDNLAAANASGDHSLSRSLPIASVDAGAYFERDFSWGGSSYVQTLEPRLYYLRVPYRNQDNLPVFDTAELTFGWTSLFRDNRFGGADRQSDANQLTLALGSRVLSNADGRERLSVGLGHITYFDTPRVGLPGTPALSDKGSAWIATADLALRDNWTVGMTQQWDADKHLTQLSSIRSQVSFGQGGVFNASYRYRRDLLEQTDLSLVLPLNQNWSLYGRWEYSLRDNQTLEALAGFEKRSCCVAIRLLGRQYIRSASSRQNLGLYLEIELTGLGSFGRDTARLLQNAILGYPR